VQITLGKSPKSQDNQKKLDVAIRFDNTSICSLGAREKLGANKLIDGREKDLAYGKK